MNVTNERTFYCVIGKACQCITEMLDEVHELGKEEMKDLKDKELGAGRKQLQLQMALGTFMVSFPKTTPS